MLNFASKKTVLFITATVLCLTIGCTDQNEGRHTSTVISGTAVASADGSILANAIVSVDDFTELARTLRQIPIGETDDNGDYMITVDRQAVVAIIVTGVRGDSYRSCGLVNPNTTDITIIHDPASDLGCHALVSGFNSGRATRAKTTDSIIDELEAESLKLLNQTPIDFTDPQAVSQAATMVADIVFGTGTPTPTATPDPDATPTPTPTATPTPDPDATPTPTPTPVPGGGQVGIEDKINLGGYACLTGTYEPVDSGCGVPAYTVSGNGDMLIIENFGENGRKEFTITSSTRAEGSGLIIFSVAEHDCDFVCNPATGTIQTACSNPQGGACSQFSMRQCTNGETLCADGVTTICAEQVCNSVADCPDNSDEDPEICGAESSCCTATNGCPGEDGVNCADECCCCGLGEVCDPANFANGCVAS